jgi:hypothetical protein
VTRSWEEFWEADADGTVRTGRPDWAHEPAAEPPAAGMRETPADAFGPEVWGDARRSLGRGAPTLALGTSRRALDRAAERLAGIAGDLMPAPGGASWAERARSVRAVLGTDSGLGLVGNLTAVLMVGLLGLAVTFYGIGSARSGLIVGGLIGGVGGVVAGLALIATVAVRRTRLQTYVYGTADVVAVSPPPFGGTVGRCELQLVIHARGVEAVSVLLRDPAVPVDRWPEPGATLPVELPLGEPRRARVLWAQVMRHTDLPADDHDDYDFDFAEPDIGPRPPSAP